MSRNSSESGQANRSRSSRRKRRHSKNRIKNTANALRALVIEGLGVAVVRRSGKKLTCREKKNLQYEYSRLVTYTSLIQTASFHACSSQQVRLHGQIYRACPNTDYIFDSSCALFYDVTAVSLLYFRRQLISPRICFQVCTTMVRQQSDEVRAAIVGTAL